MERWVLIFLCLVIVGLMGFMAVTLYVVQREGVAIRLAGPLEIRSAPQEGRITIAFAGPLPLELSGLGKEGLEARIEGAIFPRCEDGVLIPVRWNPFTGEVTWRCVSKAQEP